MVLELLGITCGSENEAAEVVIETKSRDEFNPEITDIPILECNYDHHPHALYAALEMRDWDEVSKLLEPYEDQSTDVEEEKVDNAQSPDAGEGEKVDAAPASEKNMAKHEVLTRTWVYRKNEDGTIKWRMLPIHVAVIFDAPTDIWEKLLKIHPDGAKLKDDEGNLPLHLGYSEGRSVEKVELLTKAYPEGEGIKNKKDRVPGENFGPSAAVRKVKDDASKQLAALDEKHKSQIDEKDKEIADMKENHDAEMKTLKEANKNEIEALNGKLEKSGVEHEAALQQFMEEKDEEIKQLRQDLAQQQKEFEELKEKSKRAEQRTPAPHLQGLQTKKMLTKSKIFFTKVGSTSRTVLTKAEVPVVPARKVPVVHVNPPVKKQDSYDSNKSATETSKSQVATAE